MPASLSPQPSLRRPSGSWARRLLGLLLVLTSAQLWVVAAPAPVARAAEGASVEGNYVALPKAVRVFSGVIDEGDVANVTAIGVGGIPRAGTTGVVVAVHAISQASQQNLPQIAEVTLGTARSSDPYGGFSGVSVLSMNDDERHAFSTTATIPVLDTLTSNQLKVKESSDYSPVSVTVDVFGYYTRNAVGGGLVALRGTDVLNTRAEGTPIPAGKSITRKLTGGPIPTGATAAFLDLIAVSPAAAGTLVVVPGGVDPTGVDPATSWWVGGGSTSNQVSVKLNPDGMATFKNTSTSPVDIVARATAFATASPGTGSGFRSFSTPQGYLVDIPANSTANVSLSGQYRALPATGVAAVAAHIDLYGPQSGSGFLRIWPTDQSPATASTLNYGGMRQYRHRYSAATIVPGLDGRITVENPTSQDVSIALWLTGWYAAPTGYVPDSGIVENTVVVAHTSNGPCYARLEARSSRLMSGCATSYTANNATYGPISFFGTHFRGAPAVVARPNGRFAAVALSEPDGEMYFWESAHASPLPASTRAIRTFRFMTTSPAVATLPSTNKPVAFSTDIEGRVWAIDLDVTAPEQPRWKPLEIPAQRLVGQLSAVSTPQGVRVAGRTADGDVLVGLYTATSTSLAMQSTGTTGATGKIALARGRDNVTHVVAAHGGDNTLWSARVAVGTNATTDGWHRVNTSYESEDRTGPVPLGGSPSAVFDPQTAKVGVFFWDTVGRGSVFQVWESTPESGDFTGTVEGSRTTEGVVSDLTLFDFRDTDPARRWGGVYLDSSKAPSALGPR